MKKHRTSLIVVAAGLVVLWGAVWMLHSGSADKTLPLGELPIVQLEESGSALPSLAPWVRNPSEDLERGVALAKVRGEQMRELIRTNPRQAVREALDLSEWSRLPPEIQRHVEQPFSAVANVEVLVACGEGESEMRIETVFPGSGRMETFVYGRRNGMGCKDGIPVQGIRIGGVGALREEIFQPLSRADEEVARTLFPIAVADPGGGSVAALAGGKVFYFKSRAALDEANQRLEKLEELPGPDAGAQALFQALETYLDEGGEIDFQALEESAFAASEAWTGTPRDMYVILVDFPDRTGEPTDPVAFSNTVNTTVSQQINDMSYGKTHIDCTVNPTTFRMPLDNAAYTNNTLLFTHATNAVAGVDLSPYETICVFHPDIDGRTYAGLASVGGSKMWLKSASAGVVTHELGHNYGASHAASWAVTGAFPADPAGTPSEYGDFTDIMGSGSVPSGHFNAWHKRHINWFDAENWTTVTNSGTYRVYRCDDALTAGLLRGLEIGKGVDAQYWVGYRQEQTDYETYSRGAYILWKKPGDNRSYLLDMTPQSADGKDDGGLALGQTYSDAAAEVHITPVARGGQTPDQWMDIVVNLGSFPGNSAPAATLSGPTSATVQASVLFSVAASDADGDELAYYWEIGDGLVKPNASSVAVAWLSGGTATVSCTVSDMKGGTNRVFQSVVLTSPIERWTQRSASGDDLKDIAYGGGRLVAVGSRTTAYSDDGTTWTFHNDGTPWMGNVFLRGVVHDGAQFVACGMNYHGGWVRSTFTSPDGTYWTERYVSPTNSGNTYFYDLAFGNGIYVAVGSGGSIVRSTDGASWSAVASGTTTSLKGISYGDGVFVAVGDGDTPVSLVSSNGLSWVDTSMGIDLDSWKGLDDVQYCNDRFLASGWYARILHSTDQGQTFATLMSGNRQVVPAFAYGNGTYFAAGVDKDNASADINLVSLDGANWSELSTPDQTYRNAAIFYNDTFITVGDSGSIWQSDAVLPPEPGFANWQLENGAALGFDRDPTDDADFDGYPNLAEYALGTVATDPVSQPDPSESSTGSYFQVSVDRDGIKPDIDYFAERSSNQASNDWNAADTVTVEDSSTNLTIRSAIPMASQTNEFLRLRLRLK